MYTTRGLAVTSTPLLVAQNLARYHMLPRQHLLAHREVFKAVDGVSFSLRRGEIFGVVGESG